MSRRAALVLALTIGAIAAAALIAGSVIRVGLADDPAPDRIVVVGDQHAPRVTEIISDLEDRMARGDSLDETSDGIVLILIVLLSFGWMAVGTLIVSRQPGNWAGWIFIAVGIPLPLVSLAQTMVVKGTRIDPGSVPFVGFAAAFGEYAAYVFALLPLLFLLYPDGHVPSRRWRWAVWGLIGGTTLAFAGFLMRPGPYNNWIDIGVLYVNPLGIDGVQRAADVIITIGAISGISAALATVVAVRLRFKRSSGEARQQMRWLVLVGSVAALLMVLVLVGGSLLEGLGIEQEVDNFFNVMLALTVITVVVGVPAAYLIAIFRHGLWDLDVVIKKAAVAVVVGIVFGAISVLVVGGYGAVSIAGGDKTNAAVIGGVLGLLAFPVFLLSRRIASRVVYGRRSSPYEVLSSFAERVGETYASDDVLPRMAAVLAEGTGAEAATVWIALRGMLRPEATWPVDGGIDPVPFRADELPAIEGQDAVEVRHQGELLGALSVRMPANDPMNPSKDKLVRDLASQAGLVLRNVRLIQDLRASRQRLVSAQDEERRRLERNIHDGVQQQLVALAVRLRLADTLIDRDLASAHASLAELQIDTQQTLEDLRNLARGIYPPLLADKGLVAALEGQARRAPIQITISPDGVGRYERDVEATVYFCVLEALNNTAKYANASSASIHLIQRGEALEFRVEDDGAGFDQAEVSHGTGLQGMADRLDAVGGSLTVESRPGEGTTVSGTVPVSAASSPVG